ncbi:glucans biosynthesis glucosyltransferase MdoH [Thiocapsa bogorovii]|uniref:glucans biosynthesis glucosyltransferase MdoH n=1 Tax=Thiocapsa bogorovii TaxID=521689 RepID=UPI001E4586C0|nr:glucans biosynthesis glucosyltransferase MdoH [Thiocapsa bogorovii]UHD15984.1 glucans biosynthesis glucosyltransferase MdoH [Thiocapsa bogorovii]
MLTDRASSPTHDHQPSGSEADAAMMSRRRVLLFFLIIGTIAFAIALMIATLSSGGFDLLDALLTLCFGLTLPWTVIGFWNAVIGFALMRRHRDPAAVVCPVIADPPDAITARTAILSCIRNEDAERVVRHLDRMIQGLHQSGHGQAFEIFVLSDSTWPECIEAEEAGVQRLRNRWSPLVSIGYRRRPDNPGFKAGNIQDFMHRWGDGFDFALVLDADSLMAPDTILRMVGIMQRNPRLGILQSLVVGLPSTSAFARIFQFGMRLGMRSYTLGSAWWQGDSGPYWGHNALLRVQPFRAHCRLDPLPGRQPLGGWVLSHDQVEAALMRRAGYEVRVLPQERGSWEENPPTLIEFIRRDLRWCQGNLQYLRLLSTPGLHPVGRVQLVLAILMFIGSPAWVLFMTLAALQIGRVPESGPMFDPIFGWSIFALVMTMVFAPKLATLGSLLLSRKGRADFGGGPRLLAGAFGEILFSTLIAPVMALAHTLFMGGLLFGKAIVWSPQRRDTHRLRVTQALRRLWPQTLFGIAAMLWLISTDAGGAVLLSPFIVGALLAVPIAVLTAWPAFGAWLARIGLWRIPEEVDPPALIKSLGLPRVGRRRAYVPATDQVAADSIVGD